MVKRIYGIITVLFFLTCIIILASIEKINSIQLSLAIQIMLIVYLIRITWGCLIYIKEQYKKQKYSYSIIMNLGLVLFLVINIFRHINLLITAWNLISINDIYLNTLNSFSYFAIFILPLIIFLAAFSIITNIVLIIREGLKFHNILGILFGICIIIGTVASQFLFEIIKHFGLLNSQFYLKRFLDIVINSVLCYFYCLTFATIYCNVMAARHKPHFDKDFAIILGARVKEDGSLTPILKDRVDKAIEFSKEQKEKSGKSIIFIPSGGQGKDETISEAEAMRNYLVENGINEEDIIIENKSTSTLQNLKFSKKIIDRVNSNGKVIFSTTNYHVFRSGVIANNEGIDCEGIGSKTKWYFYTNAMIREFVANLFSQKREHLALILIINISMFVLVMIGYKYGLI